MLNPASFVEEWIVVFDEPLRTYQPVILMTYQTLAAYCGRCQGSRVEYDYTLSGNDYEKFYNADLLLQEAYKYIFTVKGSHWKWPWLGSNILSRIGSKADTAAGLAASFIGLDITSAFGTYQNIKRQQDKNFPGQNVTDAEFPYSLDDFSVLTGDDPTTFYAKLVITSRSRDPISLTTPISLPDPYQLTSSPSGVMQNAANGFQLVG
jgi:hypothetical protein